MKDIEAMSDQERITEFEECIVWLKSKMQRERNYLDYRAKKGTPGRQRIPWANRIWLWKVESSLS